MRKQFIIDLLFLIVDIILILNNVKLDEDIIKNTHNFKYLKFSIVLSADFLK
jgi:hypothetical protein